MEGRRANDLIAALDGDRSLVGGGTASSKSQVSGIYKVDFGKVMREHECQEWYKSVPCSRETQITEDGVLDRRLVEDIVAFVW